MREAERLLRRLQQPDLPLTAFRAFAAGELPEHLAVQRKQQYADTSEQHLLGGQFRPPQEVRLQDYYPVILQELFLQWKRS